MTTRDARTLDSILDRDAALARQDAEASVIAEALELAPLSYAALGALPAGGVGVALVDLPEHLVRPQALRLLAERGKATGRLWGWGEVDRLEAWLREQIAAARRARLAAQVGLVAAARLALVVRQAA